MRMRWTRERWRTAPAVRVALETLAGGMLASFGREPGEGCWAYLGERGGHRTERFDSLAQAGERVRALYDAPAIEGGES